MIAPASFGMLACLTLVIGFLATASFFVYETTSNKYTRDFKKEITSATKVFKQDKSKKDDALSFIFRKIRKLLCIFAAFFDGLAVLFVFLACGLFV